MPKVSVILPVFNTGKYLDECLDSIVNQTLTDIEIICVDDGSTDNSSDILEEYSENDSRFKIITQSNQGAGAARNRAIPLATGEYVYFMDSDDYLELDALEILYKLAVENDVDFLIFKISNFIENTHERLDDDYYTMPYLTEIVGTNTFNYSDVSSIALDLCVCPPGNLFKHEFIDDIRFPEGLLFEDNVFFTHALFKADKILFLDEFLYNRRRRPDSTTTPITVKSLDTIEISNQLIGLCDKFKHPDHKKELYYRIFHNIYEIFKNADETLKPVLFDRIRDEYLKNSTEWESDEFFLSMLKKKYKRIYKCALKYNDYKKFEKCVDKPKKKVNNYEII